MAKVLIKKLTKRFGTVVAADKVDLEVPDKKFVVLLGPSGCGKTTILRCIAGLETPEEGEIYIGERLVNELEPKERDIAMVFQTYALYPHMTVFQNLAFPLENANVPKDQIQRKVEETAKLLQIKNLLGRKPRQLSGGQRQRVALGRAMVREPKVFLMDEPLSNLDAKLRVYMRAELKKLQKELGVTTIYVTHDQVEAMTMGDSVAILNQGVLQQFGKAADIYFHPVNVFVAGFIGTPPTNFFDCNLVKEETWVFDAGPFRYPVPQRLLEKAKDWPSSLVLGVRPQDIMVHPKIQEVSIKEEAAEAAKEGVTLPNEKQGKRSRRVLIKAMLEIDEPLGDRQVLDLRVGDYLVKALVLPDFSAALGDELNIEFSGDKIYVFDKKTGQALL
ncbi:MAG: ABC transporter ATP-binding protein [Candidatus Bathyarchaeia archaeon]|nr:ABC transporter ATP-binding protein [Candidatus Bathyarchaeia archaeon]